MRLYRNTDGFKLVYPELSGLLGIAEFPWKVTTPGLSKENCEVLFLNETDDMIHVKIKKRKTVGMKTCFILEKEKT